MKTQFVIVVGMVVTLLGACTETNGTGASASDPYEGMNRKVHSFNKAVDGAVLKPASQVYGETVPSEIRASLSNGVSNLDLPGDFVNHVLQGDFQDATETFFRFGLNSTIGLAGLRDPAGDAGLYHRDTSFGETLAAWGVREGAYLEVPVVGPSSERDLAGRVVDLGLNPVQYVVPAKTARYLTAANVFRINDRYEYRALIDSLYNESADSYAALRLVYLQNQARKVNDGISEDDLEDPYADQ